MHSVTVIIHDAKTQFSKLVDAAMRGEEIIIAKAGKPAAKLAHYVVKKKRKFGVLKGKMRISDDFDAPLSDDILKEFEGNERS
jgi:prevent-host-death family protein